MHFSIASSTQSQNRKPDTNLLPHDAVGFPFNWVKEVTQSATWAIRFKSWLRQDAPIPVLKTIVKRKKSPNRRAILFGDNFFH